MSEKFVPPPRDLPIPSRIKKPEWQGGMLVAANVKRGEDGRALFGQVDSDVVWNMIENRLCQTCGERIAKNDWVCFIGALHLYKFTEAPQHVECARYSIQVCPHLWKNKSEIGVSVCVDYEVIDFVPPHWPDPGVCPNYKRLKDWQRMSLAIAHDFFMREDGKERCRNHPDNEDLGKMTFDEFLKWSR